MFAFRLTSVTFGDVWVSDKGLVYGDNGIADAREQVLAKFSIPDPHEHILVHSGTVRRLSALPWTSSCENVLSFGKSHHYFHRL